MIQGWLEEKSWSEESWDEIVDSYRLSLYPTTSLPLISVSFDPYGTFKLLQDYIKLGLSCLQAMSQVALAHRATMLC